MRREPSDPSSGESYDLRPSKLSAIHFSHDYQDIALCYRVIIHALCLIGNGFFQWMASKLGLGLWFNELGPSNEIQRSQHRIGV